MQLPIIDWKIFEVFFLIIFVVLMLCLVAIHTIKSRGHKQLQLSKSRRTHLLGLFKLKVESFIYSVNEGHSSMKYGFFEAYYHVNYLATSYKYFVQVGFVTYGSQNFEQVFIDQI